MFSLEICEIFKSTFYRTPPVAAFKTKHASTAVILRIRIRNLDRNGSHEKKPKHIHALAADLLH